MLHLSKVQGGNPALRGRLYLQPRPVGWISERQRSHCQVHEEQWHQGQRAPDWWYVSHPFVIDDVLDMHMGWASDISEDPNCCCCPPSSVAVEFAGSSVTRPGGYENIRNMFSCFGPAVSCLLPKTVSHFEQCSHACAKFCCSSLAPCYCYMCNRNIKYFDWTDHGLVQL